MSSSLPARANRFRDAARSSIPATAMWVTIPWPPVLEMLGESGLDAAFIDLQHVSYGIDVVERLIMAAELAGVTPLVRPARSDPPEVSRLLDAGAQGIVFSDVHDRASAELALACLRYPPRGKRGWGGAHTRRARFQGGSAHAEVTGSHDGPRAVHRMAYLRAVEAELSSLYIVESVRGVERIDEILDAGPVDGVLFGWGDYSVEVEFDLAACDAAAARVRDVCRARNVGVAITRPEDHYAGCFQVVGVDSVILGRALDDRIRAARPAPPSAGPSRR